MKRVMKVMLMLLLLTGSGGFSVQVRAQALSQKPSGNTAEADTTVADTIPHLLLPPVFVTAKHIFKSRREEARYNKLRRDVLKVLPYAKYAGSRYKQMEKLLEQIDDVKKQKQLVDAVEEDIKNRFEKDLRKLTITQGKILIKLIDRETGRTSYVLLQELKSKFTAFFWQSVARVFGHNLKEHYDREEEEEIEKVIRSVEMDRYYQFYNGQHYLRVPHRENQRTAS